MPKINVYLPTWLAQAVKESALPVSAVCQTALRKALQPDDERDEPDPGGTAALHDLKDVLTNRARVALHEARRRPEGTSASGPGGLELLAGLVAEGGNLALVVLASLGLTPQRLSEALSGDDRHRPRTAAVAPHDLGWYVERAASEAADLGNRHVGCEHLLLAIAGDPAGPAARLLDGLGADAVTVAHATRAGAAAAAYGRAHAGVGLGSAMSATIEEIRTRLGRLEQRP